jgi:hypothetical protein
MRRTAKRTTSAASAPRKPDQNGDVIEASRLDTQGE